MLFSNPRVLPALLLCVGFGLAGYRWLELERIPPVDEGEIALAVELNYALDLARREKDGEPARDAQQRLDDKRALREEIVAHIDSERNELEVQITQGLIAGFLGLLLYLGVLVLQAKGVVK